MLTTRSADPVWFAWWARYHRNICYASTPAMRLALHALRHPVPFRGRGSSSILHPPRVGVVGSNT